MTAIVITAIKHPLVRLIFFCGLLSFSLDFNLPSLTSHPCITVLTCVIKLYTFVSYSVKFVSTLMSFNAVMKASNEILN
jgi:hypothetical protein